MLLSSHKEIHASAVSHGIRAGTLCLKASALSSGYADAFWCIMEMLDVHDCIGHWLDP